MQMRNVVPFVGTFLTALLLLLGPAPTAALAASGRDVLLDARGKGIDDPAEVAKALRPTSPRTIAELRLLLGDADPAIRGTAARVLSALGDFPVQSLLRLLNDDDRGVRQTAEAVLASAGTPAVVPVGEFFLAESCLSDAKRAAARILGAIGDPAGIPYLTAVLVKYKAGGFPQEAGMKALKEIGSPAAIGELLQLILLYNRDLGKEAHLALLSLDSAALLRTFEILLSENAEDIELKFFFAEQFNEIAGTETAAATTVKFYSTVADNTQLSEETRRRAATLRNLFSRPNEDARYYRKPLTPQRLNAMYALKTADEESPYIEERRRKEQEIDKLREERRRAEKGSLSGFIRIIHWGNR